MTTAQPHTFHIPVMGLAYTIDTPIKVAKFGIDSVVSIVDDELMERMRAFYSQKLALPYKEITQKMADYRAERTTQYLNMLDRVVKQKYTDFCAELATCKESLISFINTVPQMSHVKRGLQVYAYSTFDKSQEIRNFLAQHVPPGTIDVNIMTKVDKTNFSQKQPLPTIYNDAHASLRGFANSTLGSSVVLSAGMNPSLYSYISEFNDFYPDRFGHLKKKVILKVSDFRSALIQGSFLAKKGIWVSEYRIESGLNCGGHAFATDGLLLGSIMEEFKNRRQELIETAHNLMTKVLMQKELPVPVQPLPLKITVQGGVGTAREHDFLLDEYAADSVGWGSPFLLVPEATATDAQTRQLLATACDTDFYRSDISPLGVPFNAIKGTTNEYFKAKRIADGRPGSSCPKKLLALNTQYDAEGLCTASHKYQKLKLQELTASDVDFTEEQEAITVKSCLCVGLANPAYIENEMVIKGEQQGVVVCPGPNLAYFDKQVSLSQMVRHIYGYEFVLAEGYRPNMFIKELDLYVEYFRESLLTNNLTAAQIKKWTVFKANLLSGIAYYEELFTQSVHFEEQRMDNLQKLQEYKTQLEALVVPQLAVAI
ncbi:hypothetical protein AM493_15040 [Flavobacterium akiainvivens]|uniref:Uncharacterized protein n=1 Tax=Flavobacterium akiainvivens TaxID=1202724 RepID=A0A0N0RQW7_9FLAO|nr:hypothetical protein [Flavobacterium akiainvivens]KOS07206.1 hypothetical protein AM493_15040 [Flavobacterium akiainvivens]SFQ72604.1 hypothetical protein SAMN05444144_1183 [Flavobacterium akiainvivens]